MNTEPGSIRYQELIDRITLLEERITQLEKHQVSPSHPEVPGDEESLSFGIFGKGESGLESHFGQYGLAWLGNIVLFFGIAFLVQYLQVLGLKLVSPIFGLVSVGGIFLLSGYLRESHQFMSRVLNLNGYVLLFYTVIQLHYFTSEPMLTSKLISMAMVMLVAVVTGFNAIRRKNVTLAGLALLMLSIAGVLSDTTHVILPVSLIIAGASTLMVFRLGWTRIIFWAIFLSYSVQLIWLFNDPFMGHDLLIIKQHFSGYIYIFITAAVFSMIALLPEQGSNNFNGFVLSSTILNGLGFTFVVALFILAFFKESYAGITGSIALYCIGYAVVLQLKTERKIIAALFALFGFVTMSISIFGIVGFPKAYFLLAIQSLLVVSMAIWFRSRFIVVMNSLLFVVLLLLYLSTSPLTNSMNVSFSIVALATARILNWKKERLTIQTEFIRNFYLVITFFMVLLTLHHFVADQYITISWALAALVYFVFSLLLNNVKYRYLSLGTMFAAAIYLFIFDLSRIDLAFRVLALLFLAIASIGLSIYYSRRQKRKLDQNEPVS